MGKLSAVGVGCAKMRMRSAFSGVNCHWISHIGKMYSMISDYKSEQQKLVSSNVKIGILKTL